MTASQSGNAAVARPEPAKPEEAAARTTEPVFAQTGSPDTRTAEPAIVRAPAPSSAHAPEVLLHRAAAPQAAREAGSLATAQATSVAVAQAQAAVVPDAPPPPPWQQAPAPATASPAAHRPGSPHRLARHTQLGGRLALIIQVACWQVALATVAAARNESLPVLATAIAAAAVLLVLTAVRWRERWLYQWFFTLVRFLAHRRTHHAATDLAPAQAFLDAMSPGARVDTLSVGDTEIGVITHTGGITALFRPAKPEPPSLAALLPQSELDGPAVTAQLVLRAVPALTTPTPDTDVRLSYWQLAANRVPIRQSVWLAVQVQRDAAWFADDALRQTLANVTRRLLRRMNKEGAPLVPLGANEILPVIGSITTLSAQPTATYGTPTDTPAPVAHERWNRWEAAGRPHRTLHLTGMSDADTESLISTLVSVPVAATTIGMAARRADDGFEIEFAVDFTAENAKTLDSATDWAIEAVARYNAKLGKLPGCQATALVGALPLGGFAPC
ncbi:hypothetical protein [Amycolatopsis taiwanensis]|uniref:hypothetical protein n=1 Tax=Amycolatopsis taiwanensis TaxID=342230 RepID=UPI000483FB89|nr:hypothetical protein [Amycolatopsis taiwanensis]